MEREELIASAVLFCAIAGLLVWVVVAANAPAGGGGAAGQPSQRAVAPEAVARYWQAVAEHQLRFEPVAHVCPVDGAALDVPALIDSNRLGGVATDMLKLSVSPQPPEGGPPDLSRQDYLGQYGSCAECGATFTELDIYVMDAAPVKARLAGWKQADDAPALAKRQAQWTADECALARYLTQRRAGLSHIELGISALQGAYACNLAASVGLKRRYQSPAFYALASAQFAQALSEPGLEPAQRGFCALLRGECQRLLGNAEAAGAALAEADAVRELEPEARSVLTQIEALLEAGDFNLARAELPGVPEPPLGWYIDELLPAINGDIAASRSAWAGLDSADTVLEQLLSE